MTQKQNRIAEWVNFLRKTNLPQGYGAFERDGQYCVLGIGCVAAGIAPRLNGSHTSNWPGIHKYYELTDDETDALWRRNDGIKVRTGRETKPWSFKRLANYLEKKYLGGVK